MHNLSETYIKVLADAREIIGKLHQAEDSQLYKYYEEISKLRELLLYLKIENDYQPKGYEAVSSILFVTENSTPTDTSLSKEIETQNSSEGFHLGEDALPDGEDTEQEQITEFMPQTIYDENEVIADDNDDEFSAELDAEELAQVQNDGNSAEDDNQVSADRDHIFLEEEINTLPKNDVEFSSDDHVTNVEGEMQQNFEEASQSRRQIVEFTNEHHPEIPAEAKSAEKREEERKFKLANIKGLKKIQSLFDEDPLADTVNNETELPKGDLQRRNVPTDYLEATVYPEFKLDLNDRIAFTKILFDGSQTELNDTIKDLNGFKTLDEAKEYLSDQYYSRNWKKSDEYAQRLWSLVESRFI